MTPTDCAFVNMPLRRLVERSKPLPDVRERLREPDARGAGLK